MTGSDDSPSPQELPAASEPTPEDLRPPEPPAASGYTDAGVPTLDHVRDKIEGRYGSALGMQELGEGTEPVRTAEEQLAERKKKAQERLEEIRRSIGL